MLSRGGRPDVRKIKSLCGGWTASEAAVGGWVEEAFAQQMTKKLFGDIVIAVGVGESRASMLRGEFRTAPRILLGEITSTKGRDSNERQAPVCTMTGDGALLQATEVEGVEMQNGGNPDTS